MKRYVIKSLACFFTIMLTNIIAFAQQQQTKLLSCGNDLIDGPLLTSRPEMVVKMDSLEAFTQRWIANHTPGATNHLERADTAQEYIIPVVFHVIHNYGTEDISDAQVEDEVRILNEDYNKLNPDTTVIIPQFKPIAANC